MNAEDIYKKYIKPKPKLIENKEPEEIKWMDAHGPMTTALTSLGSDYICSSGIGASGFVYQKPPIFEIKKLEIARDLSMGLYPTYRVAVICSFDNEKQFVLQAPIRIPYGIEMDKLGISEEVIKGVYSEITKLISDEFINLYVSKPLIENLLKEFPKIC